MWVITKDHVVHQMGCPDVKYIPDAIKYYPQHPIPTPKGPKLVPIESVEEMMVHIKTPDRSGVFEGPNNLLPCPNCISNA